MFPSPIVIPRVSFPACQSLSHNKHSCSPSQVALAWLLAQGNNIVPIPGAKQRKHLEDNIAAADLSFDGDDLKNLSDVFKPGATAGTRYPEKQLGTVGI